MWEIWEVGAVDGWENMPVTEVILQGCFQGEEDLMMGLVKGTKTELRRMEVVGIGCGRQLGYRSKTFWDVIHKLEVGKVVGNGWRITNVHEEQVLRREGGEQLMAPNAPVLWGLGVTDWAGDSIAKTGEDNKMSTGIQLRIRTIHVK